MNGKSPETANTRPPEHFPVRFLGFSVRFSVVRSKTGKKSRFHHERKIAGNSKYEASRAFSGQVFGIFRSIFRCPLQNRKKEQVSP
ncbi:hypothetical protein [Pseudomonas aeruginosa]|uniref:hypothetical protein n=1 Tax=Pseudomonas aeruginosa TaxID=287 RepID=UPI0022BA3268|nr:hypothetical protein [Pseudomonas aeruginosa]